MADQVLDFAGLDSAAAATTVTEDVTPLDTDVTTDEGKGGENTTDNSGENTEDEVKVDPKKEDGTDKTPEEIEKETTDKKAAAEAAKLPGNKNTPDHIRKTLKAIRDANPKENGAAVKELHGAYERWNAAKAVFPKGVQEMKDAKALLDLVGGQEGYDNFSTQKQAIEQVDQKLYTGDPTLVDDIVADLKSENKMEAFPKIAAAFLDKLKAENKEAYYETHGPHFLSALEETNIPGVFAGLVATLSAIKPDSKPEDIKAAVEKALGIATKADKWTKDLKATYDKKKTDEASPERKQLDQERAKLREEQTKWKTNQTKTFQTEVAKEAETSDLRALGAELGPFLKMPFFKGFPKDTQRDLAAGVVLRLRENLTGDKIYQAQMKALWGAKEPNKAKLLEYHNAKVKSIARDVVTKVVQQRYPNYTKGGSAAGRIAAADAKKTADNKANATAVATGKPVYVATKPEWDSIDWSKDPKQHIYITGKAYLKSGKFVTWRK